MEETFTYIPIDIVSLNQLFELFLVSLKWWRTVPSHFKGFKLFYVVFLVSTC